MPPIDEIKALGAGLSAIISAMRTDTPIYQPIHVVRAAEETERLFQSQSKARPSREEAYAAVLAFMRGATLDDFQYHLVAGALCVPIREQSNAIALGHRNFQKLLNHYKKEAESGDLWRLTWYGLLTSYFTYDPDGATIEARSAWVSLREFLEETWPLIERQSFQTVSPDWVNVLRQERQILSDAPAAKYAKEYLSGDSSTVTALASDLGIPLYSWFWHALILGTIKYATDRNDARFVESIPRLLELVQERDVFRDEAIVAILERHYRIPGTPVHEELRDYVVRQDIWKNPKLKAAGIATAWNQVPDPVWRMVLAWVNESNLKDFFDILASKKKANDDRLAFWSQYMKQISWTKLIFGADTLNLARSHKAIKDLIAREAGAYATLTKGDDVDAFLMQIGEYIIVEFTKTGNAAYVYPIKSIQFELHARRYVGDSGDLKYGFNQSGSTRITHPNGWQSDAASALARLGIYPDESARSGARRRVTEEVPTPASNAPRSQATANATPIEGWSESGSIAAPVGANFSMQQLQRLVARHSGTGARIDDKRGSSGGRLWVENPARNKDLDTRLEEWGFKWALRRSAWYYPHNE